MGPFPTCKGPEGDKLQGTIVQHFFRIHFGTHYSMLFKSLEPFLLKWRKSTILAQICPFWAQNGGGGLFFKNLFVHFSTFLDSQLHAKFQENR